MTHHLLQLMWNRKRQNFLLAFEILLSFLVLFGVVLVASRHAYNWRQPLGFDTDQVWSIGVSRGATAPAANTRAAVTFSEMLTMLERVPGIEQSAGAFTLPYYPSSWGSSVQLADGRTVEFGVNHVTDNYRDLVKLTLIAGRWFSRDDDAAGWTPVVINERLAAEVFGNRDPIGQLIAVKENDEVTKAGAPLPRRVIGVIDEFRKDGELADPGNFLFYRMRLEELENTPGPFGPPSVLGIRVASGTPAAFEATLVEMLQAVAPDWSFEVRPIADMRSELVRDRFTQLALLGTVAAFLLLMVALGLTGVVWQSVTRRTQEFGLRRAKGATSAGVQRQVLAELMLLASLAVVVGIALVVQLPALPLDAPDFPPAPPTVWASSIAVSTGVIYLLTLLCAWYPSRLATRIQPAEALHYE